MARTIEPSSHFWNISTTGVPSAQANTDRSFLWEMFTCWSFNRIHLTPVYCKNWTSPSLDASQPSSEAFIMLCYVKFTLWNVVIGNIRSIDSYQVWRYSCVCFEKYFQNFDDKIQWYNYFFIKILSIRWDDWNISYHSSSAVVQSAVCTAVCTAVCPAVIVCHSKDSK